MSVLLTAFVWGVGVSLGAVVGLLVFLVVKVLLDTASGERHTRQSTRQNTIDANNETVQLLDQRNKLTIQTTDTLIRIAEALETKRIP